MTHSWARQGCVCACHFAIKSASPKGHLLTLHPIPMIQALILYVALQYEPGSFPYPRCVAGQKKKRKNSLLYCVYCGHLFGRVWKLNTNLSWVNRMNELRIDACYLRFCFTQQPTRYTRGLLIHHVTHWHLNVWIDSASFCKSPTNLSISCFNVLQRAV